MQEQLFQYDDDYDDDYDYQEGEEFLQNDEFETNLPPSIYNKIVQNKIQTHCNCYALTFNKDNSQIIVGCGQKIKIFSFVQEQLRLYQVLCYHQKQINSIFFMIQSNRFISGGADKKLIIWNMNDQRKWNMEQILENGHQNEVNQIIINDDEQIMVTCSSDGTIKYWIKELQWQCQQIISNHNGCVWSVSLQNNQLISCGDDKNILILKLNEYQIWKKKQIIKVKEIGYRLCFIDDEQFVFQSINSNTLEIFNFNQKCSIYLKQKSIQVNQSNQCYFICPQYYNKKEQILMSKNGKMLNFLKMTPNQETLLSTMQLYSCKFNAVMSFDLKYLVTWSDNEEIAVWKM